MSEAFLFLDPLWEVEAVRAGFSTRVPGVEMTTDREAAIKALQPWHARLAGELGFGWEQVQRAEQVHGCEVARVDTVGDIVAGADGLITDRAGICLGIYVADCAAIYLADRKNRAVGLLHSGKKGTEGNILQRGLGAMAEAYGTQASDVIVSVSPCIHPPEYEVDIPTTIREQAFAAGVEEANFHDSGACTASDLRTFYSYRREKGATGRMIALLGIHE